MTHSPDNNKHATVLLPGGKIKPEIMAKIIAIAEKYNLTLYLTTQQNLRLLGASEINQADIKKELQEQGMTVRAPGKFPKARVCVGMPYCNLGVADTFSLAEKINKRFGDRTEVKPKYKIAISGCPACCGGSKLADIGVIGTRSGFELYVGGKGGPLPKAGIRVAKGLSEDEVVDAIEKAADFHAANTPTKLRMLKLLDKEGFPTFDSN